LPVFFFGVAFADMENLKPRSPLEWLRELSIWWKIPINLLLLVIIVSWGSYSGDGQCLAADDGNCPYWVYATANETIPKLACTFTAAILLVLLALTSSWFQWILASAPSQFMGRISFSLYLFHEVFTDWAMVDTYYYFLGIDVSPDLAVLYVFLIYTPPLILISWLLTILVDGPSKDFAYELDV
jgi:peptidoglycan/LPS O-acetylase OafA/YrhL